ncbi:DUF2357 domain-containing protein [Microcoleus sp. FACHB-53]|nr:DUF2357 domain-containing protein [Microcoleus sp. FACHB-53]
MQFHNRLTGKTSRMLPQKPVLGQWQILTDAESAIINAVQISPQSRRYVFPDANQHFSLRLSNEISHERVFPIWQIPSDLLLESIRFFGWERQALVDQDSAWEEWVNISPLVQKPDIEKTIRLQRLEELIKKHLGHIEEICHRPRTYLKMETERLPVSRVQRISPHATEFLTAHTEDWEKRTFRKVRPKRVLCLIREDLLDIYENKVTARLIEHLLKYLQTRILKVQALQRELEQADDFSKDTQKIHWRNRDRICNLWGEQFEAGTALKTAEETLKILKQLKYKLLGLLDTELYRTLPKHADVGNTLKRTNILINDQHYRYVDRLWQAWSPWKRGQMKNAQQVFDAFQEVFKGFEAFCLLLISRALTGNSKANDEGLGFKTSNSRLPNPGDSIQFKSLRGNISLTWQRDGIFLLEAEGIQRLRLVPLLLPLTATSDEDTVNPILSEFASIFSNQHREQTIILYLGGEDKQQELLFSLQRQTNTLGNDRFTEELALALLPVSPLEVVSVERVARAIQWWFCSQHYQAYPYTIEGKLHPLLLEQNTWIVQQGREYKLFRPPAPDEQSLFNERLSKLINQAKSRGSAAKGELVELQKFNNLPIQTQDRFKPLLICPTCYQETDRFTHLDSQCFRCDCEKCGSTWGTRTCRNCGERYPYIQMSSSDSIHSLHHQQVGWIDGAFGRNTLAIPCWNDKSGSNFICSSCGACSRAASTHCGSCSRCDNPRDQGMP